MVYVFFAAAVLIDNLLPAFAVPTWTLIIFFLNYYNLNIFIVIFIAVVAATLGRSFLYSYVKKFSEAFFNEWEEKNLQYLGNKIGKTPKSNFIFTFIYSLTPLSTTALFVAASIARVNKIILLSGFFCGRIISYTFLAFTSQLVVNNISEIIKNPFSIEAILSSLFGAFALLVFSFIDWRELLENKKLRVNLHVWK